MNQNGRIASWAPRVLRWVLLMIRMRCASSARALWILAMPTQRPSHSHNILDDTGNFMHLPRLRFGLWAHIIVDSHVHGFRALLEVWIIQCQIWCVKRSCRTGTRSCPHPQMSLRFVLLHLFDWSDTQPVRFGGNKCLDLFQENSDYAFLILHCPVRIIGHARPNQSLLPQYIDIQLTSWRDSILCPPCSLLSCPYHPELFVELPYLSHPDLFQAIATSISSLIHDPLFHILLCHPIEVTLDLMAVI